jgi:hypothetical protein
MVRRTSVRRRNQRNGLSFPKTRTRSGPSFASGISPDRAMTAGAAVCDLMRSWDQEFSDIDQVIGDHADGQREPHWSTNRI